MQMHMRGQIFLSVYRRVEQLKHYTKWTMPVKPWNIWRRLEYTSIKCNKPYPLLFQKLIIPESKEDEAAR